jgi:CRP-like cAMP-binding protein
MLSLQQAWQGEADCQHCSLRNSVLFAGLTESDFEKIHKPIDQFIVPAGSTLYHAGADAGYLYTIRDGIVKLSQGLHDGKQRIVRLGFKADVIGLEALIEPGYQHDAVVLKDAQVCRIPVSIVNQLKNENRTLYNELLNRWNRALTDADAWLTYFSTGSARSRVANLLIQLAEKFDTDKCELFSREDIGSILGITTETASRIIAEFKRNKLIAEHNNYYRFDIEALKKILDIDNNQ